MKKIFLVSIIAISGVFAQSESAEAVAVEPAAPAAAETQTAPETLPSQESAEVAPATPVEAEPAPVALQSAEETAPAQIPAKPVAEETKAPADLAQAPAIETAEAAPVAPQKTAAAEVKKPKLKRVKKVRAPLIEVNKFKFDVNASFEIQAGKTFWNEEKDPNKDNLEEWWGRANLGFIAESEDFKGKIQLHIYPGDLQGNEFHIRDENGNDRYEYRDLFELNEAWAWQKTKYANFKLGRWEPNYKSGDFFGGYLDGYNKGFQSSSAAENQLQFGLTPIEGLNLDVALISTEPHLNKGDLRVMFRFEDLPSVELLTFNLGYRTNVFDKVYNSKSDIRHHIALAVNLEAIKNTLSFFVEGALLNIDAVEVDGNDKVVKPEKTIDMTTPITGGIVLETPIIDKIILEAEYVKDREDSGFADNNKSIKDVLGALYLQKDLTDRFTLSAGFHSFQSSKDFTLTGNLIGRIN